MHPYSEPNPSPFSPDFLSVPGNSLSLGPAKAGDTLVDISTTMSAVAARTFMKRLKILHLLSDEWAELIRPRPVSQHLQYVVSKKTAHEHFALFLTNLCLSI